jgi:hypothetical protein
MMGGGGGERGKERGQREGEEERKRGKGWGKGDGEGEGLLTGTPPAAVQWLRTNSRCGRLQSHARGAAHNPPCWWS